MYMCDDCRARYDTLACKGSGVLAGPWASAWHAQHRECGCGMREDIRRSVERGADAIAPYAEDRWRGGGADVLAIDIISDVLLWASHNGQTREDLAYIVEAALTHHDNDMTAARLETAQ